MTQEQEKKEKEAQRKSGFRKSLMRALGKDDVKKAEKEGKD